MYRKLIIALAMLSLLAITPLLAACHTTAGAGEDISKTGQAIENSANQTCRDAPRHDGRDAVTAKSWGCARYEGAS